jgi:peroxiredoxin family protein
MPAPGKLSIVVFSGAFDRVHYALMLASSAVSIGRNAALFFTMEAIRALGRPTADGRPGWTRLSPGEDGSAPAERDKLHAASGIATMEELIEACRELGAEFIVCEAGLRVIGLARGDLRTDLALAEAGIVTFLNGCSEDGQIVFV